MIMFQMSTLWLLSQFKEHTAGIQMGQPIFCFITDDNFNLLAVKAISLRIPFPDRKERPKVHSPCNGR